MNKRDDNLNIISSFRSVQYQSQKLSETIITRILPNIRFVQNYKTDTYLFVR